MDIREQIPLASCTTLRVGGKADFLIEAKTENDISEAIAFAKAKNLPLLVLGKGSNVLVPDEGIRGVVLLIRTGTFRIDDSGCVESDAGVLWEDVVHEASRQSRWGIENLAAIPGTVGGAVVQNIGAYGAELSSVFVYADTINIRTGERRRIEKEEAAFGYRMSVWKQNHELIITHVGLQLSQNGVPNLAYADLAQAKTEGVPLSSPTEVAAAVRGIRARKFPDLSKEGTAGSFFKNPVLSAENAHVLKGKYPTLSAFSQKDGTVKISLAWILDHAFHLKGYARGPVRLFENQPLVLVAHEGARSEDVELLAQEIEARVQKEIGIHIEREVETFGVH